MLRYLVAGKIYFIALWQCWFKLGLKAILKTQGK